MQLKYDMLTLAVMFLPSGECKTYNLVNKQENE